MNIICWTVPLPSRTMFSATGKRCFTIESLVAKESPLTQEDPIRPTALSYTAPADSFLNGYQSPAGRALYPNPELVFSESVNHAPFSMHPHQLGSTHLQHPHFFGTQHREPLNFYPWVLRNRFFGHRFQGKHLTRYLHPLRIKQLFHLIKNNKITYAYVAYSAFPRVFNKSIPRVLCIKRHGVFL